jgi:hypothetical protein
VAKTIISWSGKTVNLKCSRLCPAFQACDLDYVRGALAHYQAKYAQTASDYISILDMTEADFDAVFGTGQAV